METTHHTFRKFTRAASRKCGIIFYVAGVTLPVTSIRPGLRTFCTVLCMKTSDRFNGIQRGTPVSVIICFDLKTPVKHVPASQMIIL